MEAEDSNFAALNELQTFEMTLRQTDSVGDQDYALRVQAFCGENFAYIGKSGTHIYVRHMTCVR